MDMCAVLLLYGYIGTDFYCRNEGLKLKRKMLGKQEKYDVLEKEYLKEIFNKSDRVFIVGLNEKMGQFDFLFNYIVENGLDIRKAIIPMGIMETNTEKRDVVGRKMDHGSFFSRKVDIDEKDIIASELSTIAMESAHNLYYKTGAVNKWDKVREDDITEYEEYLGYIKNKYNVEDVMDLVKKRRLVSSESDHGGEVCDEAEIRWVRRLKTRAGKGFNIKIMNSVNYKTKVQRQFMYWVEHMNSGYWKLNPNDYYIVTLKGLGYGHRMLDNTGISGVLGENRLEDLKDKNIRTRAIMQLYRKNKQLTNTETTKINKVILDIIKSVYDKNQGVHLYECDDMNISLAVEKSIDKREIVGRINKKLKELELYNCFDSIDVSEALKRPWGIELWDVENTNRICVGKLKRGEIECSK